MSKIVLLEDKPERLKSLVEKLRNIANVDEVRVFFFDSRNMSKADVQSISDSSYSNIELINIWNFRDKLDELYKEKFVMIFDTDLSEVLEENVFSYRINVNYALKKKAEADDYNIWFYTLCGRDFQKEVEEIFPNHVVDASLNDNQLNLNIAGCESLYKAIMRR